MTWAPGEPEVIEGRLPGKSGWVERADVRTFNTYRPAPPSRGNAAGATRWRALVEKLYPDDAEHIIAFCAHCVQRPGVKINHAIVLAGAPGIGKDTILEPLRHGVGAANFTEVSPQTVMNSPHNDYLCAVVLRVSEAKDQGEVNRYALYETMKTMLAAPPDMHRINTKYIPQYYVANVVNVAVTTNYAHDGLYLPADDRRHWVAATEVKPEDFPAEFFKDHYAWQEAGGADDVVAYLTAYDLSQFNPKAPPKKTAAFWRMVGAGTPPEVAEISDVIDAMGRLETPPAINDRGKPCGPGALTLDTLRAAASTTHELHEWLRDRKNRRTLPHRLASCGYLPVAGPAESGLWTINNKRQTVYGRLDLTPARRVEAAVALKQRLEKAAGDGSNITLFKKP